ncbi:MAG TPA: toll/interleukin-1 receptor domain-containing protein, partial [Haloferula sp.]
MEAPSSPGTNQEYTVFISYSHSDNKEAGRQWATWLHHSLQTYEVPKELVGKANQRGEPVLASLYPVFRDEEELPADSDLAGNIKWALERSRLLVVICSPRSAKSKFVEEEIRYFKELGKGDYIVPLIVDGEPNAKDAKLECFPNALRFGAPGKDGKIDWSLATLPLGADVRIGGGPEQGWSSAGAYRADLENNTRSF